MLGRLDSEISRRTFILGLVSSISAFNSGATNALALCEKSCPEPQTGEPCNPNSIWEQYLEEYYGLRRDSNDLMSFVASGVNVRLVTRVCPNLKAGRISDSSRETPLDDVDINKPALVSHRIVRAGSSGFAVPFAHPGDTVERNGYSYAKNPLTGHPALRWSQIGPGEIYRMGVGTDGVRRLYPAVPYISERGFDLPDGGFRVAILDSGKPDRYLGIAFPCPPCELNRFDPEQMVRSRTVDNYNGARASQGKQSDIIYSDELDMPVRVRVQEPYN